nr:MAG TPA: hypothetical protein [Caudoviricetes sp.]
MFQSMISSSFIMPIDMRFFACFKIFKKVLKRC